MASRTVRQAKRKRTEQLMLLGLAGILLLTLAAFAWGNFLGRGPAPIMGILGSPANRVNILVLGVDERSDDVGRSDTMFVVSVNPKNQDMAIISVPRDTRVKIPGYGYDKINHAYAEGKYKLSQRSVENLLGITTNYYVIVDFNGFRRIIDALGGITIDVEKRMYYEDPYDNLVIDLQPGLQKLNGEDAIGYVRYRDEEGDIGRIQRQQKFMKAVMQQVTQPSTIGRLPTLIRELSGAVRTNMSTGDMVSYAKIFNDARKQGLQGYMVPGTPVDIAEISYWLPDIVETRKMVAKIMGTNMDERALAAAKQMAAEYESSIPKETPVVAKPAEKPKDSAGKDKTSQDNKTGTTASTKKDTQQKPPAAVNPAAQMRAKIINASGNDEAAIKMTSELRKQGFNVVSVSRSSNQAKMTTVIDHTDNETVLKKVSRLPFDYDLSIQKDGARNAEITVVVGSNYK